MCIRDRSVDDQELARKNAEGSVEVEPEDPCLYLDAGNNLSLIHI